MTFLPGHMHAFLKSFVRLDEVNARVAAQSGQLGDERRGLCSSGLGDGGQQLGPVVVLADFHLHVFGQQLCWVGYKGAHCGLLHFEPQAEGSLLLDGHSIIWRLEEAVDSIGSRSNLPAKYPLYVLITNVLY